MALLGGCEEGGGRSIRRTVERAVLAPGTRVFGAGQKISRERSGVAGVDETRLGCDWKGHGTVGPSRKKRSTKSRLCSNFRVNEWSCALAE